MKLIYIVNARLPTEKAHGFQICKTCEKFGELGVEIELWIPARKNKIKENVFDFYNLRNKFEIIKISCLDFISLGNFFGKAGFYLQSLSFLFFLFFEKIDKSTVIYTRNPEIAFYFSLRGYKTFFEAHGWSQGKGSLLKFFLKKISGVVCNSEGTASIFRKNRCNNVLVAPNGVDLEVFDLNMDKEEAKKKLDLPLDKKILLYTGRFKTNEMEKGLMNILKVLNLFDESVLFVAVGGSDEDVEYYSSMASNLGVKNKIILLGYRVQSVLAIYQKAADCLLMPFPLNEHYFYYMSPIKMFEYMASKRPIVASNLPSISGILDNNNSILFEPDNIIKFSESIKKILLNDELGDSLSKQAFRDVSKYTWKKRTENIINFIKK